MATKAFSERSTLTIAIVGLVLGALVFGTAFFASALPVVGAGRTYTAYFAEAGGLKKGNEVRVAGVKVGKVTGVALAGRKVRVSFRSKGTWLGDQTTAAIKIKTLLGQKFLSLDPRGRTELDPDRPIPLSRTTTPYDVTQAFSQLSTNISTINTPQLEKSLRVLSAAFADTPKSLRSMVDGLTDISRTISSRDDQLAALLDNTSRLSKVLADRRDQVGVLIQDGNLLLGELAKRRDAVHAMLVGTQRLGTQVSGLVADNSATLRPALEELDQVALILNRNQDHLNDALRLVGPYYRQLTAAMGNGRWMDAYVCGLYTSSNVPELRNDVARNCHPQKVGAR